MFASNYLKDPDLKKRLSWESNEKHNKINEVLNNDNSKPQQNDQCLKTKHVQSQQKEQTCRSVRSANRRTQRVLV